MQIYAKAIVVAAILGVASTDRAASVLTDFNAVVTGTMTAKSHVDGRTIVNNLGTSQLSEFGQKVGSGVDALDAAGSVSGQFKVFQGTFHHDKTISGASVDYLNGATQSLDSVASGSLSSLSIQMSGNSTSYSALATTSGASTTLDSNHHLSFVYTGSASGQAIFTVPASSLDSANEIAFTLGSAKSAIVNVTGTGSHSVTANFTGDINNHSNALLWNFGSVSALTANNTWEGSILGAKLSLTTGNNVDGGVYVQNFTQGGEVHSSLFIGSLPPPSPAVPLPAGAMSGGVLLGLLAAVKVSRGSSR